MRKSSPKTTATHATAALALLATLGLLAGGASAAPVVSAGPDGKIKPGIATKWATSGAAVVLTLAAGADAGEVANAITAGVAGAKAVKASDTTVSVTGVPEAKLLPLLAKVDIADDPLKALGDARQVAAVDDPSSGSSIRASKPTDMSAVFGGDKDKDMVTAKVEKVQTADFPMAKVVVEILGDAGELKKGQKLTIVPVFKQAGKKVDWKDAATRANAGAYFLHENDTVRVKLGAAKSKTVAERDALWIERK